MWPSEISTILAPILTEALTVSRSEKGNIQLFDVASGCLTIEAQHGFDAAFLSTFRSVTAENGCACGRAIRSRKLVIIPDIDVDEEYAPYREAAAQAGFRSVVSLPLIGDREKIVGVISVHRPTPWVGEADIEPLRSVAEFAAAAIIRHHQNAKDLQ
jgi:GAF domain-containing protein